MSASKDFPAKVSSCLGKLSIVLLLAFGSGTMGWFAGKFWLQKSLNQQNAALNSPNTALTADYIQLASRSPFSAEEVRLKSTLRERQREMGIDRTYFYRFVNQVAAVETLDSARPSLPSNPSNDSRRDRLALQLLDRIATLSPEAIARLGRFDENQRNRAKRSVNQLNLSSRALFDLADANFYSKFPRLERQVIDNTPAEQMRDAAIFDALRNLHTGKQYERLAFEGRKQMLQREGRLESGQGKAMVIYLESRQSMTLTLEADSAIQISIYTPTGTTPILRNSQDRRWSGELSETGFYEFVLTSRAPTTIPYYLRIEANPAEKN
jgi:serine/threonine-protein kinase